MRCTTVTLYLGKHYERREMTTPDLAYLIAIERQQELIAAAEPHSPIAWRDVVGRLRSALTR